MVFSLAGVYLGIGLFTACSYALFMDLTHPEIAATQFSAFMGATNGCEALSGLAIGRVIAATIYASVITLLCLPSIAACLFLGMLRTKPATPNA